MHYIQCDANMWCHMASVVLFSWWIYKQGFLMILQLDICGWIWYNNECNTIARKLELGSDFKLPEDTYISSLRVELRDIFCEFIGEMWSRYIGSAFRYHLYHSRYCLHKHFLILKCLILDWNFPCNFPLGNGHEALKLICKAHYVSPLGILYCFII